VWWPGWKRSAALHDGATGGMSADILLAQLIAAAKVRRQSLKIRCELRLLAEAASYRTFQQSHCYAAGEVGIQWAQTFVAGRNCEGMNISARSAKLPPSLGVGRI